MNSTITSILSDPALRDPAQLEALLVASASAGLPWLNEAE
jgi:hypothetical protein